MSMDYVILVGAVITCFTAVMLTLYWVYRRGIAIRIGVVVAGMIAITAIIPQEIAIVVSMALVFWDFISSINSLSNIRIFINI